MKQVKGLPIYHQDLNRTGSFRLVTPDFAINDAKTTIELVKFGRELIYRNAGRSATLRCNPDLMDGLLLAHWIRLKEPVKWDIGEILSEIELEEMQSDIRCAMELFGSLVYFESSRPAPEWVTGGLYARKQ